MRVARAALSTVVLLGVLPAGCGPSQSVGDPVQAERPIRAAQRVTAAVRSSLPTVSSDLNTIIPGAGAVDRLVSSGLTVTDDAGVRLPQLAEAVPTTDNGLWRVLPDGRMETAWKIRQGALWHDGLPLLAADAAFTARVRQDKDLPLFASSALAMVEAVEAPDERTVLVKWKQPFIDANALFGEALLPAHRMERVYADSRESFDQSPYWTSEFVGTGPFKVREFAAGDRVVLDAFDRYVLGQPHISEIELRFIPDGTTLIANILSGVVHLTFGARNLSYEEAAVAREQWREGSVVPNSRSTVFLFPQLIEPNPAILANVQFRRALLHSIDRQELANTFQGGLNAVPHGFLSPDVAEHQEIQAAVVKYEYDPRRAAQLVESLGFARDGEGFHRDPAGQKPLVEARSTTLSENHKIMLSVVDYWQRAGIGAEPHTVPQARAQEGEYRAAFPGFEIVRQGDGKGMLTNLHSSKARLPSNNFRGSGGTNYPRYMNPEFDALVDRYTTTIPWQDRMAVARDIIHWETDQVLLAGLIYSADANMVSNRLENVAQSLWNAHLWNLK
jgi:ABC-type transport system substrate-binding protein